MSQKKKLNRAPSMGGKKRSGSVRGRAGAKPQTAPVKKVQKKAEAPTANGASSASNLTQKKTPTRAQKSQKRPPEETAPILGALPKRRPNIVGASDAPPLTPPAEPTRPMPVERPVATAKNTAFEPRFQAEPETDQETESEHPDSSQMHPSYPESSDDLGMLGIGSRVFPPHMDDGMGSGAEWHDPAYEPFDEDSIPLADDPSVETRIREIEERLDGLLAAQPLKDLDEPDSPTHDSVRPANADTAVDAAREVLQSEYYRKNWGRGSLSDPAHEIDDFGMDPAFENRLKPALEFLFKRYFRVEVEGIRNVPNEGRAVIVANHSGALPLDGTMLREAIRTRHPVRSDLRWLAEDFSFYLPFLGVTLNRLGAVRACPENAERLLSKEHLVGVFPEGAEGTKKLYKDRYNLQRFGRGGFVRLCLKTRSPIVPCAIIGAEETNPILYRFDNLSKLLGLEYLPVTPTFPLLGPLGLLPAPTKWKIVFGEPIDLSEYGPQAAQDHVLVGRLSEQVRTRIADLLETSLRRRKSIWL